jgi:hypothetical protein
MTSSVAEAHSAWAKPAGKQLGEWIIDLASYAQPKEQRHLTPLRSTQLR